MVSPTKRPCRGTRKTSVRLEIPWGLWRRPTSRSSESLAGYEGGLRSASVVGVCVQVHLAAQCCGTDRSKNCWRCGTKGHTAVACAGKPHCYPYAEKRGNPRIDLFPGTTRCAAFQKAAPMGRPWETARGAKQANQKSAEVRTIAPKEHDPIVMPRGGSGVMGWRVKQGSFEFSGYCFGRVPYNVRKCILYLPWPNKKTTTTNTTNTDK